MVDYRLEKLLNKLFENGDYGKQAIVINVDNNGSIEVFELEEYITDLVADYEYQITDLEEEIEDLKDQLNDYYLQELEQNER